VWRVDDVTDMRRDGVVPEGEARLDRALARLFPDFSRSRLQKLVREGQVSVGGVVVTDPSAKAEEGAAVVLVEPPPAPASPRAEIIPLSIVYEDEEVIVIEKPAGLVVHPGAGNEDGTLVNALLAHCGDSLSGIGGVARPGIVHRIDKDTSGLLVVAKTDRAHRSLSDQFADHGRTGPLERAYLAFVWGAPEPRRGTIEAALGRSSGNREKMAVMSAERGRHAITHYRVEEPFAVEGATIASLVRCTLETGRTHQIRVHLAHIHHPLLGDEVYGAGFRTKAARLPEAARSLAAGLRRQALHATLLQFAHPATGEVMRFESPLPSDLAALREALAG
jgi:23S rRNA pseudouridine1911/1915/1917 synthase